MPRAIIYCRVSTRDQVQNLSLKTQRKACVDYCKQHSLEVDHVFEDKGQSAKTTDRAEFQDMLTHCRTKKGQIDFLVVYALSRFARDKHDHFVIRAVLSSFGVTLRSVTEPIDDSSTGKLMEGVLAAFAQFDNDVKAERTKAGMKAAMAEGRWPFIAPVGYLNQTGIKGKTNLVHDPKSGPLVRKAFKLFSTGLHTKADVLRRLTTEGLCTENGKPVSPQTFHRMLRNPLYAGIMEVRGWPRQRGSFEPLVGEDLFRSVQAILAGKKPVSTPYTRNHPDFPLRRFVRCGSCQTPLTGGWSKGRSRRYAYYSCRKRACRSASVAKEQLETAFVEHLRRLQPKPQYLRLFREIVMDVWSQKRREETQQRNRLEQRLKELEDRKQRLVDAFLYEKSIDQQTYDEQLDLLREEIAITKLKAHDARLEELDIEGVLNFAEYLLSNVSRLWIELSLDQRQRLQKILFPKGLEYVDGEFGTALTASIFSTLHAVKTGKSKVASPTGFEPVSPP